MIHEPRKQSEITLRFVAEPSDMNVYGKVHGGAVMKWIDQAGYACAVGWSASPCVTVYVGGIRFYKPILIGNVVEVHARLIYTGNTSMHIAVDVSSGDLKKQELVPTTHCVIVFVALDGNGVPVIVAPWQPRNEEEKALSSYASRLMELGKKLEDETRPHLDRGMADHGL
jgi:acyl-CoA hydrolase